MRYTHHFTVIRRRKHTTPISLVVVGLIVLTALTFGFTQVNAFQFIWGFFLSFIRVLFAYIIALVIALITSLLVTKNKKVEDIALPILDVLQSFPSFALLPLFLTIMGKNVIIVIFLLFITMIWPIMFALLSGIKSFNSEVLDAATIFGARGFKKFEHVTLPLIFPSLVTGSIVAWGEAWEAIIATEIIVRIPGVGTYLADAGEASNNHILIIGILLLMLLLFILNKLFWIPLLNSSTKYQS